MPFHESRSSRAAAPHDILGVSPNASPLETRQGFRRLALATHPDRLRNQGLSDAQKARATEVFIEAKAIMEQLESDGYFTSVSSGAPGCGRPGEWDIDLHRPFGFDVKPHRVEFTDEAGWRIIVVIREHFTSTIRGRPHMVQSDEQICITIPYAKPRKKKSKYVDKDDMRVSVLETPEDRFIHTLDVKQPAMGKTPDGGGMFDITIALSKLSLNGKSTNGYPGFDRQVPVGYSVEWHSLHEPDPAAALAEEEGQAQEVAQAEEVVQTELRAKYNAMKWKGLKELCLDEGLPENGERADLVNRLVMFNYMKRPRS